MAYKEKYYHMNCNTIDLSIVPLYKCNLNCSFCYLGTLKNNDILLNLNSVKQYLAQYDIRVVDIYGGEISLLSNDYVNQLIQLLGDKTIYVTTNTIGFKNSKWYEYALSNKIHVSFSYDIERQNTVLIKNNILEYDKLNIKYSIICLDISNVDFEFLASLKNLESISIKPFSKSKYNNTVFQKSYMYEIYQDLSKWPTLRSKIEEITEFRDKVQHYFLLPDGKLYDIRYDLHGNEYFCELSSCKFEISANCLQCKYYRKCFNEHYYGYIVPKNSDCLGRKITLDYINGKNYIR